MELKGSKTEENLYAAFAGESMAAARYEYFSGAAGREGLEQMKWFFTDTSHNEREHAKRIFRFLGGEGKTIDNLKAAAKGEHEEWSKMYKDMEQTATAEGFTEIAAFFKKVAEVEEAHEKRFLKLLESLEKGEVFKDGPNTVWHCRNCGYLHVSTQPPETCPVCLHPQGYFERHTENY